MPARRKSRVWSRLLAGSLVAVGSAVPALAATATQITPIAIYHDAGNPFGLAYDSSGGRMYFTQGDSGDNNVHRARAFKTFSAAELAGFVQSGGVYQLTTAQWEKDVGGSFFPGTTSAHFASLAYDAATGKLVMQPNGGGLRTFNIGGGSEAAYDGAQAASFADGLDVDSGDIWFSPDVGAIYKNNVLFKSTGQVLPSWTGLGSATSFGYSGVEQVGSLLWAVDVHNGADTGRSRTIVSYDLATGVLNTYDPDGDPTAARWEDMAFDGRYLYAADLRGNANGTGLIGDIYVFDVVGDGGSVLDPVPLPPAAWAGLSVLGLLGLVRRHRRSKLDIA